MSKRKVARATIAPTGEKRPAVANTPKPDEWKKIRPSWRLNGADRDGPYCWQTQDDETKVRVLEKLRDLDGLQWEKVLAIPKGGHTSKGTLHHEIDTKRFSGDAKARLKKCQKDDIERMKSIRITQTVRVFGIMDGPVFHLYWYDPDHSVCPSELRNT
jgi:hypothetical protein